jgi:AcrR family transcriptional regulator
MARTLDLEAHTLRRDEFVDVALRLMQLKGWDQTSIQDVLSELDASKGAFYHYFDSKAALLEAVIERMTDAATVSITPIVDDPSLTALDKFEGVFAELARWKGERTELLLAILEVWRADDNAIVREKFRQGIATHMAPPMSRIVAQGLAEGRFVTSAPDDVARVLVSFFQSTNEMATEMYFDRQAGRISYELVQRRFDAYWQAFERILGLAPGSFRAVDPAILRQWYG